MAYKKEELIERSVKAIEGEKLHFIEDVCRAIGVSKQTFYTMGLDDVDVIKDALLEQKIAIKRNLRSKWYNSENATLQIALYRLLANDEEFKKLTQNNMKVSGDKEAPLTVVLNYNNTLNGPTEPNNTIEPVDSVLVSTKRV